MNRLRLHLFGPFEVWQDGDLLSPSTWPSRKARQLLKILLTFRGRVVATEALIEWLWPDLNPKSARNSLWVAVSGLRHMFEPQATGRGVSTFILTEHSGYRFDPASCWEIDVDTFLARLRSGQAYERRGDLATAIDEYRAAEMLYRGDYLAEDPYEEWAIATREHLREGFLEMESALAVCCLSLGRYGDTLAHARQVLGHDPCRESAWRLVMEAHYRAGEQDRALQAFERCRSLLARELGVDPLPETRNLHGQILCNPPRTGSKRTWAVAPLPVTLSVRLPFVGREEEWAFLGYQLQQAIDGHGRVILVAGEPGIGKSRMLEELARLAIARGVRVLAGRCYELEQNIAYAPIVEVLRSALPGMAGQSAPCPPAQLAVVAELLPEVREVWPDLPLHCPLPADEERTRLLGALAQVIRRCSQGDPLVLLLDDLHWGDPSTLQLVHYLGRQILDEPLLLVGAYRWTQARPGHPLTALRAYLAREGVLAHIDLSAFSLQDVSLLLHILGGEDETDSLAQRLYSETEGHPFFVAEMLRTWAQEGLIAVDAAGNWHLSEDLENILEKQWLLPPSVRAAALGRLDRLPPDDRALLDLASVIGREFSLPLLAYLVSRPETLVAEQADQLSAHGFLEPREPDRYEFGHDLIRRAAYDALSAPRRRLLHRHVAEALLAFPRPAEGLAGRVAAHYEASDRPWLALEYALVAADQAAHVTAFDEALAWCQRGMEIAEMHPTAVPSGFRTRLHLQWRRLWYYRGDLERTLASDRAALAAARREGDTAGELQALWHLAHDETQVAAGDLSGLRAQALALARDLGDPAALARSLARLGSDGGFLAAPAERKQVLDTLDQAVSLARQVGDPALLHHVLCEMWGVGRLPQARAALEEALRLVRRLGDRGEEVGTLAKLADLLVRQGDLVAATEYARQGMALAAQMDSPAYGAWNQRALGQALAYQGQIAEGLAHLGGAARIFETHGWQAMLAGTLLRQGTALRMAGQENGAVGTLEKVLALSQETHEIYESAFALAVVAEIRLEVGKKEAGRQALDEAVALAARVGLPWHRGGTLVHVAAAWLLLGEPEVALVAADEAIRLAREEDLREVRAHGLWRRGQALQALGRPEEACAALEGGLAQAQAMEYWWMHTHLKKDLTEFRVPSAHWRVE
jgi:DNA-binding SARP family transcriptional activator